MKKGFAIPFSSFFPRHFFYFSAFFNSLKAPGPAFRRTRSFFLSACCCYSYSGKRAVRAATSAATASFCASKSKVQAAIHFAIFRISSGPKPRVVTAGVPMRTPEVTKGFSGSLGTVFLFAVMCTSSRRTLLPSVSVSEKMAWN